MPQERKLLQTGGDTVELAIQCSNFRWFFRNWTKFAQWVLLLAPFLPTFFDHLDEGARVKIFEHRELLALVWVF